MLYFIEDAWTRAVITISCRWSPSDILSLDVRLPLTTFHSIISETSLASELILYINWFLTRFPPSWFSGSSQQKKKYFKQFTFGRALNRLNQNYSVHCGPQLYYLYYNLTTPIQTVSLILHSGTCWTALWVESWKQYLVYAKNKQLRQ